MCGGGVGDADCGGGSSVVRDGNIEDSVCRDIIHECGSGRCGGCVCVGGRGRHGVGVCGGVHDPGHGLGVCDHGVADLQWEAVDIADELLDDTFPFNETEGLKVRMNQQQNVFDFLQLYLTDKMLELIVIETNRFASQPIHFGKS